MTLRQRLATWLFGKEIQKAVQKAVFERDELWARTVYDSFYREGGHPIAGGTVVKWNPIRLSCGMLFEPSWGMVWRWKPDTPYQCPVHVVSETELHLKVLDAFRPEENEKDEGGEDRDD